MRSTTTPYCRGWLLEAAATRTVPVEYFRVDDPIHDREDEVWQDYQSPILIQRDGQWQALIASYGMEPKRKVQPGNKH